jgi:hypothetical protein
MAVKALIFIGEKVFTRKDHENDDTVAFSLSAHTFLPSAPWPYINQPKALVTSKAHHTIFSNNIHMNRMA